MQEYRVSFYASVNVFAENDDEAEEKACMNICHWTPKDFDIEIEKYNAKEK